VNLLFLTFVNLGRNKLRTTLTFLSVMVALFLFCALFGVLDTLQESIEVGSEQRIITRNAISLVFPLPMSYRQKIEALPGVKRTSLQNWFGGQDPVNPRNFYAQFAVDAETFFPMYAKDAAIVASTPPQGTAPLPAGVDPKLAAFMEDQAGCVVGEKLMRKMGWTLGQTVSLNGTIYTGSWPFTIRAVYRAQNRGFGDETMFFHFRYLDQKGMNGQSLVGLFILELTDPSKAADIAKQVDTMFENSAAATHTETEKAFQAGFVSWYGNLPFVIRLIGLAIVFAILLVAANTMVMAVRERTSEVGVLKTLGFEDGTIFRIVLLEAAFITLGGGVAGALLAKFAIEGSGFNFGGFLPPMSVYWSTVFTGIAMALLMGAVSGLIPAWQASRLSIVNALRRVD
jgi:putative ABC transport system permease protein